MSQDTLKQTKTELREDAITLKNVTKYVAETIKDVKVQAEDVKKTRAGVEKAADRVEVAIEKAENLVESAERIESLLVRVRGNGVRSEAQLYIAWIIALLVFFDPLKFFAQ